MIYVLITIGAAARLTRLTTRDQITQPLRDRLLYSTAQRAALRDGSPVPPPVHPRLTRVRVWLHQGVTCDWCAGFWVSVLVVGLAYGFGPEPILLIPGAMLAVSHAVGALGRE